MTLAKCREHKVAKTQSNANVTVVGMNPDCWYKYGKLSIAGPVNELTAIATLPIIPIVPFFRFLHKKIEKGVCITN